MLARAPKAPPPGLDRVKCFFLHREMMTKIYVTQFCAKIPFSCIIMYYALFHLLRSYSTPLKQNNKKETKILDIYLLFESKKSTLFDFNMLQ